MRWLKHGKIFDPTDYALPVGGFGFSQSPQALILEDRIRVYFSTREKDITGKFLSHVSFVDFDKKMKHIIGVAKKPVINLGQLGCFDEHGIFPFNILKEENKILAYTTGWSRRVSVSADASIGLAISYDNGLTFEKYGNGPIMSASLKEPFLVGDAFVKKYDNTFHMWYIYGTHWIQSKENTPPDRVYKIAHATSINAIDWDRNSKLIIPDKLDSNECQALPTVLKIREKYHMYFCYRPAYGFREKNHLSYRLGYAYSDDLKTWIRDDEKAGIDISSNGWDSEMQSYPHLFECDGIIYMLYNGNEFGRHGFGLATLVQQ